MEEEQVYAVISEKNGYQRFENVFRSAEGARKYVTTAMNSWNRGKEAGFSYYILKTWLED